MIFPGGGIENPNKGLRIAGLFREFPDCGEDVAPYDDIVATDAIDAIDANGAVVLIGVERNDSSTTDTADCYTIFWGLTLSTGGRDNLDKALPLLNCIQNAHKRLF